jgi:myosin heavy subunit
MTSTSTRQVNFRLPQDLIDTLGQQARLQNLNRTDLMIKLLQESLKPVGSRSVSQYSSPTPSELKTISSDLEERVATLESYMTNSTIDSIALTDRVATLEDYVTNELVKQVDIQIKRYIDSQLAKDIAKINNCIARQNELQLQVDNHSYKLVQLEKTTASIQTSLNSLANKDDSTSTPKVPATSLPNTQSPSESADNTKLTQDSEVTKDNSDNWLTLGEAYRYAVAKGYEGTINAFRELANSKNAVVSYGQWGLSIDLSRRYKVKGQRPKWLRPLI